MSNDETHELIAYVDGGSRGNPGPAAAAVLLFGKNRKLVRKYGTFYRNATNNEAEYLAVFLAITRAVEYGCQKLTIYSDSELIVKQLRGEYKVKSDHLYSLYAEVLNAFHGISNWTIKHISRAENTAADTVVNIVLDIAEKLDSPIVLHITK